MINLICIFIILRRVTRLRLCNYDKIITNIQLVITVNVLQKYYISSQQSRDFTSKTKFANIF